MKTIYENEVKGLGPCVDEFKDMSLLVIFGENAPEEIKDYCYSVSVNPIDGTIEAGQTLKFDDQEYKITAVGTEAPVTLKGLGHCSISFTGATTAEMPGTIYVESKPMPTIAIGTKIQIVE